MMVRIVIFILLCGAGNYVMAAEYAVARTPAPVLNDPGFVAVFGGADGRKLKTDSCNQVRELEFIALPGSVFTVVNKLRYGFGEVFQVETAEYAATPGVRLYVDSRFLRLTDSLPPPRRLVLPSRDEIAAELRGAVGSPYVWGGNVKAGVPELVSWFFNVRSESERRKFSLVGLDCSGLLYHATEGWTPRNTSQLLSFGRGVVISGKQAAEIAALLQPLDLIVWNGHVVIVLDRHSAIESRLECRKPGNGGVVITSLPQRIAEIMRTRQPADSWPGENKDRHKFVVRRWYGKM